VYFRANTNNPTFSNRTAVIRKGKYIAMIY